MFILFLRHIFIGALFLFAPLTPSFLHSIEATANKQESQAKQKKICLTMIVKNESKIIERCLNSVKDIVDCISICDTGSTDNTKEIIMRFMKENRIPGKIHEHAWKNFGHNRTLSAKAAQETLKDLKFSLPDTYLLLLDADMLLEVASNFNKKELSSDMYMLRQKDNFFSYYNTRLVRASKPWECVGVTHEYWACKEESQESKLEALAIDDREDGGSKSDKHERDIKLLTEGLKEEPNNERYMFYLAQAYMCQDMHDDAIRLYKMRIQKGGWIEEVWYSKMMIGEIYEKMGFWDHALHWYLDAYNYHPTRAEPLHKVASHYRLNGQNDLAYLFAKQGSRIPFPKDDYLFISYPIYDYQFDEEISIAAYYTAHKDDGLKAADRLILKKSIPNTTKDQALKNLLFYVKNIPLKDLKIIYFNLPPLSEGSTEFFNPTNPSIQKRSDGGYDVICRTVNYEQKNGVHYQSREKDNPLIRTKNFLLHYDQQFNLISQHEIVDKTLRKKVNSNYLVTGLEDCRLINKENNSWFLSTTYDTHIDTIGQSLCKMKEQPNEKTIHLESLTPLIGPKPQNCEKNWLPFMKEGELYVVYGYDPFTIYKLNTQNGTCTSFIQNETSYDFSRFRGSAAPISFDDGYLLIVHEVIFNPDRNYLHRFVYLDQDFNIQKISHPFTFIHLGIEYCCGMTIDHSNQNCIITIGHEDQKAYLLFVDLNTIRSLLKPLPLPLSQSSELNLNGFDSLPYATKREEFLFDLKQAA